ncbi:MAG: 23S rRNA (adenine(2503)-C(2))-methyltransferase RlmN [Patescibacteria group bacterium]|nr:23S rRNA (adenine(2503)-C(2))-methyltransferase RlmN [Patescibacteria group bacterium]
MNLERLENILRDEPKFRLKQAKQALFINLISDWEQATNFPLELRQRLNQECPLEIETKITKSQDENSIKALIYLDDGLSVETVLLNHLDGRNTVCVSSQVGCSLGCVFCATGKMGFKRNLTRTEIVSQVLFFARYIKSKGLKVNNIVFMGMGEPFLNYENVMGAIEVLNDKDGLNIGARHISISTVGIINGIKKLAQEKLQLNLALSLHAPNDDLRSKIIPYNRANSIKNLIKDVNCYLEQTGRRLMIEYLMIDDFNDSREQALELAKLLKQIDPPLYFVNLIAYNPTDEFKPSPAKRIKDFKLALNKQGIEATERHRFGQDIEAACGQLAGKL